MFNIIVAFDIKYGIGINNRLPWHVPDDLKQFSKLTRGNGKNAVIMGKNTWNSLPIKMLAGRDNLILSSELVIEENTPFNNYIKTFNTLQKLINFCEKNNYEEVWIIGGSQIYNLFLDNKRVDKIYATIINRQYKCDTFFPEIINGKVISKTDKRVDNIDISYLVYQL
ncbi:Dihydrofolate reductase [Chrysochromulina ericina virus CeV-01B]|uniref:dihydrofolate reductase n=1 Tax=Chrysochromulina ericina virus CeV-01B TaxID=3070830 RepID=A0A0N9R1E2_9VIRU|nr:Dihydrofolate reductase [Chrysochromulina ericina virus]ALH23253.1 Dihydrofolate reductase [Chrysochromulina ericina virus CeV-01B]